MAKSKSVSFAQLVAQVASSTGLAKSQVKSVLESMVDHVHRGTKGGARVVVKDLGGFFIRQTKARTMHSALLGKKVKVPAKRKPSFRAAKAFKSL